MNEYGRANKLPKPLLTELKRVLRERQQRDQKNADAKNDQQSPIEKMQQEFVEEILSAPEFNERNFNRLQEWLHWRLRLMKSDLEVMKRNKDTNWNQIAEQIARLEKEAHSIDQDGSATADFARTADEYFNELSTVAQELETDRQRLEDIYASMVKAIQDFNKLNTNVEAQKEELHKKHDELRKQQRKLFESSQELQRNFDKRSSDSKQL